MLPPLCARTVNTVELTTRFGWLHSALYHQVPHIKAVTLNAAKFSLFNQPSFITRFILPWPLVHCFVAQIHRTQDCDRLAI